MQKGLKMLKVIGYILLAVVVFGLVTAYVIPVYVEIGRDYTKTIEVDSSEKVEYAISNAVHDVKSRNFVVNTLSVKYCWINKTFTVRCGGIDRGNLFKK